MTTSILRNLDLESSLYFIIKLIFIIQFYAFHELISTL
jgi:hypothetical protein